MTTLFLIVFVDLVGFGIIIPLLPFYGEFFGASPAQVGLLMAVYSFTQFLTAPLWGRLSDRVGRRPVLTISLAGIALAYGWLAFADNLGMLFAARALAGVMAGNIGVAFAYAADVTEPRDRAKGMGLIGAAFGLGFIFGPAIGGMLAGSDPLHADYRTPALTAAALSATALVMALVFLKEPLSAEIRSRQRAMSRAGRWRQLRRELGRPVIGLLIGIGFLAAFVFSGMETTFAMWSERQFGWGPQQNGYLFALVGLISAGIQGGVVGRLARRFGEGLLVTGGALLLAIGMVMIPLSHTVAVLTAAMVSIACGFGLMSPSLSSLISLQIGGEAQGGALGVSRSATTLARIFGPSWAGAMFLYLGKDWPYFAGALIMVVVIVLAARTIRLAGGREKLPAKE